MLQTRIRHRLPAPAVIALLCLGLALLTVSSKAQNLPLRSYLNTVNFLEASGQSKVSRSEIYDDLICWCIIHVVQWPDVTYSHKQFRAAPHDGIVVGDCRITRIVTMERTGAPLIWPPI